MKTLLLTLALAATLVRSSYAVEYVTLMCGEEVSISPASIVEQVGAITFSSSNGPQNPEIRYFFNRIANSSSGDDFFTRQGGIGPVTGVVKLKNVSPSNLASAATFKITPANEINAVAPTSLLVIPENSTGNYNIVVETSSDTATWTPFHSQTVSANDAKRFFRTRIVKAE
jgi:hypothetical protein